MGRDTIQLENAVSTISQEYLLEFSSEYDIAEGLHPELPGPEETIVDFREGKVVIGAAKRIFPTVVDWRINAPKDVMPAANSYSTTDVSVLDTHRTPIQKQPEALLCLVGLSRRYFMGDDVYPIFLYDDDRDMDLFNLISAPNPTKVKTGTRSRAAHEVSLITVTASLVIDMEDAVVVSESSRKPSIIEKSPLDFANEDPPQTRNASTTGVALEEEVAAMGHPVNKRRRKRGNNKAEGNSPPKVLRRDNDAFRPTQSTHGGKSLASIGLDAGSLLSTPAAQDPSTATKSVSDMRSRNRTPSKTLLNFLSQYNINLAWQVTMSSQLRLTFEQEVRLLKKARVVVSEVHGLQNQTKNLKTLLEAEVDMKKVAEAKNVELAKELDSLRVQFSDLQVSNNRLSEQVLNLQTQVTGEEKIKATFEEFKKYEDDNVKQRCAEMDARLDKLSVDFDEELYPHMLTAIAGHRWVIGHGMRLAVMKCVESSEIRQAFADVVSAGLAKGMSEGLKYGIEHGKAGRDLADVEAYDPEANSKLVKALQDLKDLKYLIVNQLERLKDAPMELLMASLHLESDTGKDTL
ncbi:hypothetical protein Tco_1465350 [Tanacetum coccineum]